MNSPRILTYKLGTCELNLMVKRLVRPYLTSWVLFMGLTLYIGVSTVFCLFLIPRSKPKSEFFDRDWFFSSFTSHKFAFIPIHIIKCNKNTDFQSRIKYLFSFSLEWGTLWEIKPHCWIWTQLEYEKIQFLKIREIFRNWWTNERKGDFYAILSEGHFHLWEEKYGSSSGSTVHTYDCNSKLVFQVGRRS